MKTYFDKYILEWDELNQWKLTVKITQILTKNDLDNVMNEIKRIMEKLRNE